MSCPHATTTTVAWAFGELAPHVDADAHALHVAACDDCTEALDALEAAEAATAPLAGALPAAQPPAPEPAPVPANLPTLGGVRGRLFAVLALAAALALGTFAALVDDHVGGGGTEEPVAVRIEPKAAPVPVPVAPIAPDLDDELDALELELDALRTDPSIL